MPPAKPALVREPTRKIEPENENAIEGAPLQPIQVSRLPNALAGAEPQRRPIMAKALAEPARQNIFNFQPRIPVLQGEACYRGWLPVDGTIYGQLGASGNSLTIKQRPRNGTSASGPELNGEIIFKDMLRINGHIAGHVSSAKGTLIVDGSAVVDACVEVGIAIIGGTINGDVVGHERVEIGPGAVINGSVTTRSLVIKPGAIFEGDCRMLEDQDGDK